MHTAIGSDWPFFFARSARVALSTQADGSLLAEIVDDGAGFDLVALKARHGSELDMSKASGLVKAALA